MPPQHAPRPHTHLRFYWHALLLLSVDPYSCDMYLCNVTAGNKSLRHWGRVKITSQLTVAVNDPYNTRHGAPYCDRNPPAKPESWALPCRRELRYAPIIRFCKTVSCACIELDIRWQRSRNVMKSKTSCQERVEPTWGWAKGPHESLP